MSSPYVSAYNAIRALLLSAVTRPALIQFKKEYRAYINKVEDLNRSVAHARHNPPESIKDSVILFRQIGDESALEESTSCYAPG